MEATGLQPVTLPGGKILSVLDPYAVIDFDDVYFGQTVHRVKTNNPVWGEVLEESVDEVQIMQVTIFHASTVGPDPFIAHVQILVSELISLGQQGNEELEVRRKEGWGGEGRCPGVVSLGVHTEMSRLSNTIPVASSFRMSSPTDLCHKIWLPCRHT